MFGRARILLTMVACAVAMPAAPQAPVATTTAFDGMYEGSATEARAKFVSVACATITSVHMAITGGHVVIHESLYNGGGWTYHGSVNAGGEVSALYQAPTVDILSGTIHDKVFAGDHMVGHFCRWNIQMVPGRASTTPFDGMYIGVSRESSTPVGAGCPANGVPVPLTIWNGVVWSDRASWDGIVSQQGALAIRNVGGTRVEGRVDGQGIIRGRGKNTTGCDITFVWRKQAG